MPHHFSGEPIFTHYQIGPEANSQLATAGLETNERLEVEKMITRIMNGPGIGGQRIWNNGNMAWSGPPFARLTDKEKEDLQLLRFWFEVQFVQNEVPELLTKEKYKPS